MFIPLEIVRETIETAYILNSPPNRPLTPRDIGVSTKPPWKTLAALSCTSHAFREIVLEVWFSTLRVTSPEDLEHGCRTFPRVSKWTRSLHCHLNLPLVARFNLSGLQALHAIRIHNSLFPNFGVGHFVSPFDLLLNVPPGVVQVQIASTVVFPPHAFKFNSISSFANIRALDWVTNNAWCDLCHIDQAVVVRKPFPQSVVYEGGKAGLPVHFRKQLSCLQHLETVSFTITVFQLPGSPPTYGVSLGDTQHAWTGECEDCIQTVLSDESFRSRWTALKTGEVEEMEGSGGKKYRFYPIPSLRRVEWNFDHPGAGAEVEEDVEEDELEEEEGGGEGSGSGLDDAA